MKAKHRSSDEFAILNQRYAWRETAKGLASIGLCWMINGVSFLALSLWFGLEGEFYLRQVATMPVQAIPEQAANELVGWDLLQEFLFPLTVACLVSAGLILLEFSGISKCRQAPNSKCRSRARDSFLVYQAAMLVMLTGGLLFCFYDVAAGLVVIGAAGIIHTLAILCLLVFLRNTVLRLSKPLRVASRTISVDIALLSRIVAASLAFLSYALATGPYSQEEPLGILFAPALAMLLAQALAAFLGAAACFYVRRQTISVANLPDQALQGDVAKTSKSKRKYPGLW